MGSRKDDPVFNVKFVQLVESKPCLWNSTLPEYSKKDEIQKAWQEVANETKDTVRNCRERWRTIRSSFLRSLKLSRTSTGRGKRKYYLSKYLQFLIPFTRSRLKNSSAIIAQRKAAAAGDIPPMTHINNMPIISSDDTKDSSNSTEVAAIAESDVMVTLHEEAVVAAFPTTQHATNMSLPLPLPLPLNLQTIKQEKDVPSGSINENMPHILPLHPPVEQQNHVVNGAIHGSVSININSSNINGRNTNNNDKIINNHINPTTMSSCNNNVNNRNNKNNSNNCSPAVSDKNIGNSSNNKANISADSPQSGNYPHPPEARSVNTVDLTEFAEWIKSKNEHQRHCLMTRSLDADQSFLNSLHPYLREMSGKQNRRFRQKVVALIDAVLDNAD